MPGEQRLAARQLLQREVLVEKDTNLSLDAPFRTIAGEVLWRGVGFPPTSDRGSPELTDKASGEAWKFPLPVSGPAFFELTVPERRTYEARWLRRGPRNDADKPDDGLPYGTALLGDVEVQFADKQGLVFDVQEPTILLSGSVSFGPGLEAALAASPDNSGANLDLGDGVSVWLPSLPPRRFRVRVFPGAHPPRVMVDYQPYKRTGVLDGCPQSNCVYSTDTDLGDLRFHPRSKRGRVRGKLKLRGSQPGTLDSCEGCLAKVRIYPVLQSGYVLGRSRLWHLPELPLASDLSFQTHLLDYGTYRVWFRFGPQGDEITIRSTKPMIVAGPSNQWLSEPVSTVDTQLTLLRGGAPVPDSSRYASYHDSWGSLRFERADGRVKGTVRLRLSSLDVYNWALPVGDYAVSVSPNRHGPTGQPLAQTVLPASSRYLGQVQVGPSASIEPQAISLDAPATLARVPLASVPGQGPLLDIQNLSGWSIDSVRLGSATEAQVLLYPGCYRLERATKVATGSTGKGNGACFCLEPAPRPAPPCPASRAGAPSRQ